MLQTCSSPVAHYTLSTHPYSYTINLQSQICQVKVTIKFYYFIIPQGPWYGITNIKTHPHFVLSWYQSSILVKCKYICQQSPLEAVDDPGYLHKTTLPKDFVFKHSVLKLG